MIKASELRIGNRLRPLRVLDPENIPLCGYAICAAHIAYSEEELNYDWEPIPLTPEILEKCGFVKSTSPDGGPMYSGHRLLFLHEEADYTLFSTDAYEYDIDRIGKPFQFLHQLQNLTFALTGKELQVVDFHKV